MVRARRNSEIIKLNLSKKLYSSLSYPMILYQFFGSAPFSFSENGIEKSILRYSFTAIRNLLLIGLFLWIESKSSILDGDQSDLQLHALFSLMILLLSMIIAWIEAAVTIEKWATLLKQLVNIDRELTKYNIVIEYARGVKKSFMVLAGLLVLPSIIYISIERDVDYTKIAFIYFVPHCITTITGYIYCEMVILIGEKLTILNDILQTLIHFDSDQIYAMSDNREEESFDVLCHVCSWHHDLVKLILLLNETFGFRMVGYFIYSFTVLSMHIFLVCRYFKMELNLSHLTEYISLILCFGYSVHRICKLCEYSIQEAKKAGSLIHQIETTDKDMIDEIEMFSLQIMNEDLEFNAAGFFPINYALLFSIIGGVTTFTIILIQLQDSSSISAITATEDMISTNISTFPYY